MWHLCLFSCVPAKGWVVWEGLGMDGVPHHPKSPDHCALRSVAGTTGQRPDRSVFCGSIAVLHVLFIMRKKILKFFYYFWLLKVRIVVRVYLFFLYITCLWVRETILDFYLFIFSYWFRNQCRNGRPHCWLRICIMHITFFSVFSSSWLFLFDLLPFVVCIQRMISWLEGWWGYTS